jgi:hypothetical protein
MMRPRLAPVAIRIAISRRRDTPRPSKSPATFAHERSSKHAAPTSSSHSGRRVLGSMRASVNDTAVAPNRVAGFDAALGHAR